MTSPTVSYGPDPRRVSTDHKQVLGAVVTRHTSWTEKRRHVRLSIAWPELRSQFEMRIGRFPTTL